MTTDAKDNTAKLTAAFDSNMQTLIEDVQEIRARDTQGLKRPTSYVVQSTPVEQKDSRSENKQGILFYQKQNYNRKINGKCYT